MSREKERGDGGETGLLAAAHLLRCLLLAAAHLLRRLLLAAAVRLLAGQEGGKVELLFASLLAQQLMFRLLVRREGERIR